MAFQLTCVLGFVTVLYFGAVAAEMECLLTLQDEATKCFSEAGINLNDPEYKISGSENGMIFESMMSQKPDAFCKRKEEAKTAINCLMAHMTNCLPPSFRGIMPSSESMGRAMDEICKHRNDINLQCVTTKYLDLFNCGQAKAKEYVENRGRPGMQELLCLAYELNPMCQKQVLKDCGCMTSKVYSDISYDILYPASCPKLNPGRVTCSRVDLQKFVDDGLGDGASGHPAPWFWSLLLASFMALIASWFY